MFVFIDLLSATPSNTTKELDAIVNARRYYNSCVHEEQIETDGIDTILSLINNEFGGWPIMQGFNWNNSNFNFAQLLIKLNEYNSFSFYAAATSINDKNSSSMGIRVGSNIIQFF